VRRLTPSTDRAVALLRVAHPCISPARTDAAGRHRRECRGVGVVSGGWNIFVIAYVILTFRTFARVDSAEFRARMDARGSKRPVIWRVLTPRGDGPTLAFESAVVAFAVVLVLPHVSAININDWVLVPASISILLSCWTLSLVSYALHYAQNDFAEAGLDFPGTRSNAR
jgi:uncharacterized membrane protein